MTIKRNVFYSFFYDKDVFRVQQIRQMGVFEGEEPVTPNAWEEVKKGGDAAIQSWIDKNMEGKTCVVVLIGEETHDSAWIRYEINKALREEKALLGIYIHNLKCPILTKAKPYTEGKCSAGINLFETFTSNNKKLSSWVKCYNPNPESAYADIKGNIDKWIEDAIAIRKNLKVA